MTAPLGKRRRALSSPLLVCWIALLLPVARAAVYLPVYNESFISLPARFGNQLSADETEPPVSAYLTLVRDQPYMCSDELKKIQPKPPAFVGMTEANKDINSNNATVIDPEIDSSMRVDEKQNNNTQLQFDPNNIQIPTLGALSDQGIIPLPEPEGNIPVALLVERGMCTFWEKAIMASNYGDFVKYVIIYDDQIAPDLVPMSSEHETDLTLLFVSANSGRALKNYIMMINNQMQQASIEETNNNNTDNMDNNTIIGTDNRFFGYNLVVQLDGTSPYFESSYGGLNMAAYFLAAMSGFLAFLIFFGCLLICAQCGCITAAPDEHGRIVLFAGGPGIRHTEGLARMIRVDKLTADQVLLLDEEEFDAPEDQGDDEDNACCAICLEEFEHKEKVRVLPCGHKFHEDCLVPWLTERHASCPLCKMDVLKHVKELEAKNKKDKNIEEGLDDSASQATQSSHTPRSFWYRLRGWSLVDSSSPEPSTASSSGEEISNPEGVSEIEMETWTPSSPPVTTADPSEVEP